MPKWIDNRRGTEKGVCLGSISLGHRLSITASALILLLFWLCLAGLFSNPLEQPSAVEAGALAAVKDLSAIVISDPNFGLIGLTDCSPVSSTDTTVRHRHFPRATGINTLFSTIRLHLIAGDAFKDAFLTRRALTEYRYGLAAQHRLLDALRAATLHDGTGKDVNGRILNPTVVISHYGRIMRWYQAR